MRNSGQCVKCKGQSLWVVDKVHHAVPEYLDSVVQMVVTSYAINGAVRTGELAAFRPNEFRIDAGSFQVIICAACGYTEWYAYDIERLKDIPGVRRVGPNAENGGPYR